MNNNILWSKNIHQLLFNHLEEDCFNLFIADLESCYTLNKSKHIWKDFQYLNTCLDLFLSYIDKIKNPVVLFYAIIFSNIPDKSKLKLFIANDRTYDICNTKLIPKVLFLLNNDEFVNNDFGVTQEDFNYYQDILKYSEGIKIESNIFVGLSIQTDKGLSFKFKRKNRPI